MSEENEYIAVTDLKAAGYVRKEEARREVLEEVRKVQRYDETGYDDGGLYACDNGDWVNYTELLAALDQLEEKK